MELTEQQHKDFYERGYLHLESAVPISETSAMLDRLWALLAERDIVRGDRRTWPSGYTHTLQRLRRYDSNPLDNETVRSAMDAVLGGEWKLKPNWGQALVTFPTKDWNVPAGPWHLDHGFSQNEQISGINVFPAGRRS